MEMVVGNRRLHKYVDKGQSVINLDLQSGTCEKAILAELREQSSTYNPVSWAEIFPQIEIRWTWGFNVDGMWLLIYLIYK